MRTLLLAVVLASGVAHADRRAAEQLEKDAKQTGDLATYEACGKAYLDIYNADPAAPDVDETLYNAGVCFSEGKSSAAAIQAFEQVRKARSPIASRALGRLARLQEGSGRLAEAANLYAEYAQMYTAEKDALAAMSEAVLLRRALGDDAKEIADTKWAVNAFGRKQTREMAQAMVALTPAYERKGTRETIAHLREILRSYSPKLDRETLLWVYVRLGELAWQAACKQAVDGLCVKRVRERTLPLATPPSRQGARTRCGPATATVLTAVPRDAALVKESFAMLAAAIKIVESYALKDAVSQAHYARVRMVQADHLLEQSLAIAFPKGLDFPADKPAMRQANLKRFAMYVADKQKVGAQTLASYEAVVQLKDPFTAIAALARSATLQASFADQLLSAEIPKSVQTSSATTTAFCDTLTDVAEPLAKVAVNTYEACLVKASELGMVGPWQKLCERELEVLSPSVVPSVEMLPAPRFGFAVANEPPVKASPRPALRALLDQYAKSPGCASLGGKLERLAKQERLAEAFYMAGLDYDRCGKLAEAKEAYESALKLQPYPAAQSNLGRIAWLEGRHDAARKHWQAALAQHGKLFAAHLNLAVANVRDPADPKRPLDDVKQHAYSAALLDEDSPLPHALLALALTDRPLAQHHAQRAYYFDDKSPAAALAMARVHADDPSARYWIDRAGATETAALASARIHAQVRRWADALKDLDRVTEKSYEAAVLRGVATHGMREWAKAEAHYTDAIALDAKRPEAHFNLGAMWKASAIRTTDPAAAKALLRKAADSYRRAGTAEAKALATDCDKAIAAL